MDTPENSNFQNLAIESDFVRQAPTDAAAADVPLVSEKRTISKNDVFKAADSLAKRNEKVTAESIRQEIGDRGSYTTIQGHMNEWRRSRLAERVDVLAPALKPLADRITGDLLKSLIPEITRHVAQSYDSEKAALERELRLVTLDLQTANENNDAHQAKIEGEAKIAALLGAKIRNLEQVVSDREEIIREKDRLQQELSQAALDLAKMQSMVHELTNRVEESNRDLGIKTSEVSQLRLEVTARQLSEHNLHVEISSLKALQRQEAAAWDHERTALQSSLTTTVTQLEFEKSQRIIDAHSMAERLEAQRASSEALIDITVAKMLAATKAARSEESSANDDPQQ